MACCCCACLDINQQLLITSVSGEREMENGPGCVWLNPCSSAQVRSALVQTMGEYSVVSNDQDAVKRCVYGPVVEFMEIGETCLHSGKLPSLSPLEYVVVTDTTSGTRMNVVGPTLYRVGPYEEVSEKMAVYNLSKNQYMRIKDQEGKMRVERGEQRIVPLPSEEIVGGVQDAVNIDHHSAVLVRSTDTGSLELCTEHGLFFPSPYQEIVEVQKKIVLEEYHSVVYKDQTGQFHFVHGDSDMRDFFLPPFCELVTQEWSIDLRKEHRNVKKVWKFDRRAEYMNYEFNCRTADNVELVIGTSFFWSIIDV
eukprot:Rhum_TRINITY_DN16699_c0_g1::Rhum_TRINITY_DN16699_c0_g1_i1::g.164086::m.164086